MVILEVDGYLDAADGYVRVVEGSICDDSYAEENGRCYKEQGCSKICA
jgi:hypothetical protein